MTSPCGAAGTEEWWRATLLLFVVEAEEVRLDVDLHAHWTSAGYAAYCCLQVISKLLANNYILTVAHLHKAPPTSTWPGAEALTALERTCLEDIINGRRSEKKR